MVPTGIDAHPLSMKSMVDMKKVMNLRISSLSIVSLDEYQGLYVFCSTL